MRAAPADGCTVMMASHELDLARRLATREVRIVAGQVHAVTPAPGPARAVVPPEVQASA